MKNSQTPISVRNRKGKIGKMSYEASRHNYEGGRALSTVSTYKPSKSKATMQRVTTQTKATGGGLPTQIDVRGKGAHKKLAKVGLRKSPKK